MNKLILEQFSKIFKRAGTIILALTSIHSIYIINGTSEKRNFLNFKFQMYLYFSMLYFSMLYFFIPYF
jgi:hypothetical protein